MQPRHLQMLHKDFSLMDDDIWDRCPADTNAVEWKNQDSKDKIPQQLQTAMINLYKADKYMCTEHMAWMELLLHTVTEVVKVARKLLCQEVSTEQRSLRVILMLCMAPLIVKITSKSQQSQRGTFTTNSPITILCYAVQAALE